MSDCLSNMKNNRMPAYMPALKARFEAPESSFFSRFITINKDTALAVSVSIFKSTDRLLRRIIFPPRYVLRGRLYNITAPE